jgi:ubiquitin-protein ligase
MTLFLPPAYPHVPPKVTFRTTADGRLRFNPNLYTDGKVCLSLLGTWSGDPWIPDTSSLLQVRVV